MKVVTRFAPWIVFLLLGMWNWRVGVFGALGAIAVTAVVRRSFSLGVLDVAMATFFLAAAGLAIASPHSGLADWLRPMSAGWTCMIALASTALGHPFTLDIAREQVPPAVAESSRFRAVNRDISLQWAAAFAGMAASGAAAVLLHRALLGTAATALALAWAVAATRRIASRPVAAATPAG